MKKLLIVLAFVAPIFSYADTTTPVASGCFQNGQDISEDPTAILTLIQSQKTCYDAATVAKNCAWGSSMDQQFAGAAANTCGADLKTHNPSKEDMDLLTSMYNACDKAWANKQGTMYISINAFCQLSAVQWMDTLTSNF